MLPLFHDDVYDFAAVWSTPAASYFVYAENQVCMVPAATDSIVFGSARARFASGAFGFWMSSVLHAAAMTSAAAPNPRLVRMEIIDRRPRLGGGSEAEFQHRRERAGGRVGRAVHP